VTSFNWAKTSPPNRRSGYFHMRQLRPVIHCSSEGTTKAMVQAFITSRLGDTGNALYYTITDNLMRRLQSIQNVAVRLVTDTQPCVYISPLRQLHWLLMRQRVGVQDRHCRPQAFSGYAPRDLTDHCCFVIDTRP